MVKDADSYTDMLDTVRAFHEKHRDAFWSKMKKLEKREGRIINGRVRVSEFRE